LLHEIGFDGNAGWATAQAAAMLNSRAAMLKADMANYGKIIKTANIKIED